MNQIEEVLAIWISLAKGIHPIDPRDGSLNYWLFIKEAKVIIEDAYKYRVWLNGKKDSSE